MLNSGLYEQVINADYGVAGYVDEHVLSQGKRKIVSRHYFFT